MRTGTVQLLVIALLLTAAIVRSDQPKTRPATTQPATKPSAVLEPTDEPAATQPADQTGLREGSFLDLNGQLTYNAKREPMFKFRDAGGTERTLGILPNRNLARMEETIASEGPKTWFHISVVVTAYRYHNFILIRDASRLLDKP